MSSRAPSAHRPLLFRLLRIVLVAGALLDGISISMLLFDPARLLPQAPSGELSFYFRLGAIGLLATAGLHVLAAYDRERYRHVAIILGLWRAAIAGVAFLALWTGEVSTLPVAMWAAHLLIGTAQVLLCRSTKP